MKRSLKVIIAFTLIIITCIVLVTLIMHANWPTGKPILTNEEKVTKLNTYVKSSLYTADNDMYLYISPTHNLVTPQEFPELKNIVSNLILSIKVKEVNETDTSEFLKPFQVSLNWSDTQIYVDIDSDAPNNQIYIYDSGRYYKAEASMDSIEQVTKFVSEFQ